MNAYGHISFRGENFSPTKVEQRTEIRFNQKNEVGEIGLVGKYKGKTIPYGWACIDFDSDNSLKHYWVSPNILDQVYKNLNTLKVCGAGEIMLKLNFPYKGQCNLEMSPEFLADVAKLNITLGITCYEQGE